MFAESRRRVTFRQAADLQKQLIPEIVSVGVFVNESIENVLKVDFVDMFQLHGTESDEYICKLKSLTDKSVIKAGVSVSSAADYLLFDGAVPGSGKVFDWGSIPKVNKPIFLAGGLNIGNVEEAIKSTAPYAVDVSSGVETDGLKDLVKINDFIRRVRNEC